jgi:hypothetical protein
LPKGTVECRIWGRRFLLFAWPKEYTRNSFAPVFCGSIRQNLDGSTIQGRFMFHPIVMLFLIVWFGGALFGVGLAVHKIICQLLNDGQSSPREFMPLAFTVCLVAVGFILVYFGLRLGQDQREAIDDYLHETLDAQRVSSDMNAG